MKRFYAFALVLGMVAHLPAHGQGIFNILPDRPTTPAAGHSAGRQMPAQAAPTVRNTPETTYRPMTPPAASAVPQFEVEQSRLQQFDRFPNESDDAYNLRMKANYERSKAEMARAAGGHLRILNELNPRQFYGDRAVNSGQR